MYSDIIKALPDHPLSDKDMGEVLWSDGKCIYSRSENAILAVQRILEVAGIKVTSRFTPENGSPMGRHWCLKEA